MLTSTKLWYSSSPGEPDGPSGLFLRRLQRHRRSCSNPPLRVKLKMPDKTKNQRNFYAGLFGGRGWIRTTEAEKQQIYSLSPLATREHAHIHFLCPSPDDLFILSCRKAFVNCFFTFFFKCVFRAEKRQSKGGKSPAAMQARQSRRKKPAGRN